MNEIILTMKVMEGLLKSGIKIDSDHETYERIIESVEEMIQLYEN